MALLRRCPDCGTEFSVPASCCSCTACHSTYLCPRCGLVLRDPVRVVLSRSWDEE